MSKSVSGTTVLTYDEVGGLAIQATFRGGTPPVTADRFAAGCILTDTATGKVYKNTGTSAAPSWTVQVENVQETILVTGALSTVGTSTLNSAAGAIAATLGAAEKPGTIKVIVMQDATASSTVTIANHQTSDPEVATFDAVDETGVFMWTGTEWITIFATCTFV